jgi:HYDIN/CFA65/VesB-like, Ig-like domain
MFDLVLAATFLLQNPPPRASGPHARLTPDHIDVGAVLQGGAVERDFVLTNEGDAPLRTEGAELTGPLRVDPFPSIVAPGVSVTIRVRLAAGTLGPFNEELRLQLNDPATPQLTLTLQGEVVPLVQVLPNPLVALIGPRGVRTQSTVEIANHSMEPVRVLSVEVANDRVLAELATVEAGRRYRLTLTLNDRATAGRELVPIVVHTDSATTPVVHLVAATFLRERVYTFPDAIDLGAVPLADWKTGNPALTQKLMIYQTGGKNFEATLSSDVPGLTIDAVRGPEGDRWQATISWQSSTPSIGKIHGTITIRTNDPEFPMLTVPVTGEVLQDAPGE